MPKQQPIQKLLEFARASKWSDVQLADSFGVTKQVLNNWKARGLPPARHVRAAEILGCTVEELVSGTPPVVRDEARYVYGPRDHEAQLLAAEITRLEPEMRAAIETLIGLIVARQKRSERKKSVRREDRPEA